MQYSLKLAIETPNSTSMSGKQFRHLITAINDSAPPCKAIDPSIFHYSSNNKPMTALSPYRFSGGKMPSIVAIGNEAVAELQRNAPLISEALSDHFGKPLNEQKKCSIVDLKESTEINKYTIKDMIIATKPGNVKRFLPAVHLQQPTPEIISRIEDLIRSGLDRQSVLIETDIDTLDFALGDIAVDMGKPNSLFVREHKGGQIIGVKKITFRTSLNIIGAWHVGNQVSMGYGSITKMVKGSHR